MYNIHKIEIEIAIDPKKENEKETVEAYSELFLFDEHTHKVKIDGKRVIREP